MIRFAVPQDIFSLAEMGRAFWEEAGFSKKITDGHGLEFDMESFGRTIAALIEQGILFVAEEDGEVVGMAGAGMAPAWWNRNVLTGQELFFYCKPDHRKGTHGRDLMQALESAAKSRGVVLFSMSAEEGMRAEALGRLYRQQRYFPSERMFWKVLAQ